MYKMRRFISSHFTQSIGIRLQRQSKNVTQATVVYTVCIDWACMYA